jgi:quinone-modifying oxidoreductase subunit QmoA
LKQATYVRERYPDAKIYIFYIDLRSPGYRYERFYEKIKEDENIFLIKGKVAEVGEEPATKNVTVVAENAVTGEKIHQEAEMVVLATGMQPTAATAKLPADLQINADGFMVNDFEKGGMFAVGCANKPADVVSSNQNATGMALKAIQTLVSR